MMKNVYSVGQVNTYIKNMFAQDFMMQRISVKGEVSNCKYHSSGHIYFTLKDPAGTINAIMFAGNRRGLSFQMKEGDKVIVTGSVEVYERDGKYQLYAREIELDGAGNLYLKFEALKKELEEMGMFAPDISGGLGLSQLRLVLLYRIFAIFPQEGILMCSLFYIRRLCRGKVR